MNFKEAAQKIQPQVVAFRRNFHSEPEVSFHEKNTNEKIKKFLTEQKIEILPVESGYSVVALIRGGKPGKTFAMRGDIDALPMPELRDVPYKSKVEGVMHACGHDAHTSMMMGTALLLNEVKEELHGNVKIIFQAAEEMIPGGAKGLVEAGVLENPKVDAIMAYHVFPSFEAGKIGYLGGPVQASADTFQVNIHGKGGHGAYPHNTIDPIVIAANLITTIQSIVGRSVDPLKPAVITIGSIHGGTKENIIADDLVLTGTIRAMDEGTRALVHKRMGEVCAGAATSFGCTCEYLPTMGYPATINSASFIEEHVLPSVRKVLGEEALVHLEAPTMGAEDFAYYLQKVPGAMLRLGSGNKERGITAGAHNSLFDIDEECLWVGISTLAQTAYDFLSE